MALPTILVDSATGSDTLTSGAGPATALTGTKARTRSAASQLHVGFFEGTPPDLSGVLTDGSHVLRVINTTAGQRYFSSIAGVKNTQQTDVGNITNGAAILSSIVSTTGWTIGDVIKIVGAGAASADLYSTILTVDSPTQVTINDNAGTSVTGAVVVNARQVTLTAGQGINTATTDRVWAIGGKLLAAVNSNSSRLWDNNSAAGDAKAGWIVEMASGHTETIAGIVTRCVGDATSGPIILRGVSGAATPPVITGSNNGNLFDVRSTGVIFRDFEVRNTNATKTASIAFALGNSGTSGYTQIINVKIAHSTNKFWKGIRLAYSDLSTFHLIRDCEIAYTASFGIEHPASGGGSTSLGRILWNYIHDTGGAAIQCSASIYLNGWIHGNIIYNTTGIGISLTQDNFINVGQVALSHNTVDLSSSDGFKFILSGSSTIFGLLTVVNNIASNNGGYGFNFSSAGFTAAARDFGALLIDGNDSYNNTSNPYNPASFGANDPLANPTYTAAASGDFRVGTGVKALGLPLVNIGTGSGARSYVDIGAAQRIEPTPPVGVITGARSIGTF